MYNVELLRQLKRQVIFFAFAYCIILFLLLWKIVDSNQSSCTSSSLGMTIFSRTESEAFYISRHSNSVCFIGTNKSVFQLLPLSLSLYTLLTPFTVSIYPGKPLDSSTWKVPLLLGGDIRSVRYNLVGAMRHPVKNSWGGRDTEDDKFATTSFLCSYVAWLDIFAISKCWLTEIMSSWGRGDGNVKNILDYTY